MKPEKVLFVDDEKNVLSSFERAFHRKYQVHTTPRPGEVIELMRREGPFKVVVTDLRMPAPDGLELAEQIERIFPLTSTIMLTGQAHFEDAVSAVNSGNFFRFLLKPSSREALEKAITDGIRQYDLLKGEKQLLENTFRGSIKLLSETLSQASPEIFGYGARVSRLARTIGAQMGLKSWELDVAAMLAKLGFIAVPGETAGKYIEGEELNSVELRQVEHQAETAAELIRLIPRLDKVADIVSHQNQTLNHLRELPDRQVAQYAGILKLAGDFERTFILKEKNASLALAEMIRRDKQEEDYYDPAAFEALKKALDLELDLAIEKVNLRELQAGMIFCEDVRTEKGQLLISRGIEITESTKLRLQNIAENMPIQEPFFVIKRQKKTESAPPEENGGK